MPLYRAELLAKKPLRYAALIHDVSQVLHLPFDWDDGSYARDRSGYNNRGTIYGATLTTGKIGMARSFDGIDDKVEVSTDLLFGSGDFSVAIWVKPGKLGTLQRIIGKATDFNDERWEIYQDADDTFRAFFYDAGVSKTLISTTKAKLNVWINLLIVREGDDARLYVNGNLEDTESGLSGLSFSGTYPLKIGAYVLADVELFKGVTDEVRAFKRALTQAELRILAYRRW